MQGRLSFWLIKHGLAHRSLGFDYQGVETLQIKPENWHSIAVILYVYGYNYLRSQCAYDVAPGGLLSSVYHLTRIEYGIGQPEEVCIKVFVPRRNPITSSVFWIWKCADFQERESYDILAKYYVMFSWELKKSVRPAAPMKAYHRRRLGGRGAR